MASTRSTRQITQPPRPNVVRDEAERYRHARQAAAQLDAELLAARRAGHPRIPRLPAGCDQQGRHPQAAEACTELGADDDDPLRAARGVVWGVLAALLIWCAIALAGVAVLGLP